MSVLWPVLLLAGTPGDEALEYARIVAANGALATVGLMIASREVEEMVAAHPELSGPERSRLRTMGREMAERQSAAVIEAEAQAFAAELSLDDLRELARFAQSDASRKMRGKLPQVIDRTMKTLSTIDFGGSLRKNFCAATGKLCNK